MTRLTWLGLPISLVLVVSGNISSAHNPGPRANSTDTTVAIQAFGFRPKVLEIQAGTRVTWTDGDEIEHTVTTGDGETPDGRIDGVMSGKGKSFTFSFTMPGSYAYFCNRHHFMHGEIRVLPTGKGY